MNSNRIFLKAPIGRGRTLTVSVEFRYCLLIDPFRYQSDTDQIPIGMAEGKMIKGGASSILPIATLTLLYAGETPTSTVFFW